MSREIHKLIKESKNYQEAIGILVKYTQDIVKRINQKHENNLELSFYDRTKDTTDLYGWVLDIRQRFVKEEWGFPEDDPEPYFSFVSRVEVTELEINNGNPKTTIHECLDEKGQIKDTGAFGASVEFSPIDYVNYLNSMLSTGNARLRIEDISKKRT